MSITRPPRDSLQWGRVVIDAESPWGPGNLLYWRTQLQWGRVVIDAESLGLTDAFGKLAAASMGPRRDRRGVLKIVSLVVGRVDGFNGAAS